MTNPLWEPFLGDAFEIQARIAGIKGSEVSLVLPRHMALKRCLGCWREATLPGIVMPGIAGLCAECARQAATTIPVRPAPVLHGLLQREEEKESGATYFIPHHFAQPILALASQAVPPPNPFCILQNPLLAASMLRHRLCFHRQIWSVEVPSAKPAEWEFKSCMERHRWQGEP